MRTVRCPVAIALLMSIFLCACKSRSQREVEREEYGNNSTSIGLENNGDRDSYRETKSIRGGTTVRMRNANGVYYIPITVDGIDMEFVFDTGASAISISSVEAALLLKQGELTRDDVLGQQQMVDATGRISVGAVVNLKTVTIGEVTLRNVEATVVDNIGAPLLLGQSALSKFGKISIDYDNNTIEFR